MTESYKGMISVQGSQIEMIGTSFLGLLSIFLLFALLRAQKRNRQLLRELMETQGMQAE